MSTYFFFFFAFPKSLSRITIKGEEKAIEAKEEMQRTAGGKYLKQGMRSVNKFKMLTTVSLYSETSSFI